MHGDQSALSSRGASWGELAIVWIQGAAEYVVMGLPPLEQRFIYRSDFGLTCSYHQRLWNIGANVEDRTGSQKKLDEDGIFFGVFPYPCGVSCPTHEQGSDCHS